MKKLVKKKKGGWVYVLCSGSYYKIGSTSNLIKRKIGQNLGKIHCDLIKR